MLRPVIPVAPAHVHPSALVLFTAGGYQLCVSNTGANGFFYPQDNIVVTATVEGIFACPSSVLASRLARRRLRRLLCHCAFFTFAL